MSEAVVIGVFFVGAYLLGSLPFGLLIGKAKGVDIREHGSGNIGATNAMRVLGKPLGIVCFVLDVLKGSVPVLVAGWSLGYAGTDDLTSGEAFAWIGIGVASVAGHMYSVYLGFTGGKGVATAFGALLALWPWVTLPALAALAIWYAALKVWRYVGLSSCLAAIAIPLAVVGVSIGRDVLGQAWPFVVVTSALAALVVWKHRGNLSRLRAGTEPKVGRSPSG